jgi:hypothetical protein
MQTEAQQVASAAHQVIVGRHVRAPKPVASPEPCTLEWAAQYVAAGPSTYDPDAMVSVLHVAPELLGFNRRLDAAPGVRLSDPGMEAVILANQVAERAVEAEYARLVAVAGTVAAAKYLAEVAKPAPVVRTPSNYEVARGIVQAAVDELLNALAESVTFEHAFPELASMYTKRSVELRNRNVAAFAESTRANPSLNAQARRPDPVPNWRDVFAAVDIPMGALVDWARDHGFHPVR